MATLPNTGIRLYTLEPMQTLTTLSRANAGIEQPSLYNQCMHRMALSLQSQCRNCATLSRVNACIDRLSQEPMQALSIFSGANAGIERLTGWNSSRSNAGTELITQEPMQALDESLEPMEVSSVYLMNYRILSLMM